MDAEFFIDEESLKAVEGTTLFYPCSGNDLIVPLRLFSPTVSEFWFVDVAYFANGDRADQAKAVLSADDDYELIEKSIEGPPTARMQCRDLEPCVLTETYNHRPTGKTVKIHRRRGFGKAAFDKVISSLGVFFYRGDSEGAGGSGYHWLRPRALRAVLAKLVSGGLIVTDGSQHDSRKYRELWKHHGMRIGREAMELATAFSRDGCSFTCVGYAGNRYGPTLIWRVVKQT